MSWYWKKIYKNTEKAPFGYSRFCTPCWVSSLVCDARLRFLQWTARLLSQWLVAGQ